MNAKILGSAIAVVTLQLLAGYDRTWDFDGRTPEGGTFRAPGVFTLSAPQTPQGAFVFEAELVPGPGAALGVKPSSKVVWDNADRAPANMDTRVPRGRAGCGFTFKIDQQDGQWMPCLSMANATGSCMMWGPRVPVRQGEKTKVSFVFGADRTIAWNVNGTEETMADISFCGEVAPSDEVLPTIGDFARSGHAAFDGRILRISVRELGPVPPVGVFVEGPHAFVRAEPAKVKLVAENFTSGPLRDVTARVSWKMEQGSLERTVAIGDMAAGERKPWTFPLETRLVPGARDLVVVLSGKAADGKLRTRRQVLPLRIAPRFPDRMKTVMWGVNDSIETVADFGFNHAHLYADIAGLNPDGGGFYAIRDKHKLDQGAVFGVDIDRGFAQQAPGGKDDWNFARTGRDGKPVPHRGGGVRLETSDPVLQEYARKVAAADAELFKDFPAFAGVLPCSEWREHIIPSFRTEAARYKAETGRDVPAACEDKVISYRKVAESEKRFPDGLVPDDDEILLYYKWLWRGGDGWPSYISGVAQEYAKRLVTKRPFSYWDPAVRCPPIRAKTWRIDALNQWGYSIPDPMNIAGPAEEIIAMAGGLGIKKMINTQLICYRSQMAPVAYVPKDMPQWAKDFPDAEFPAIPPDHLQEAVWSMIAKPVDAISFHGWGCIKDEGGKKGYCFTNPEVPIRLRHLLKDVVAPLGPMLKRLGRARPRVAVLESFTTCVFGGPHTWGWRAPAVSLLQRARLDPCVVYEEDVETGRLAGIDVVYAPQCKFLSAAAVAGLREFQARGGIVLADSQLARALVPDVLVNPIKFAEIPKSDHAAEVNEMEAARANKSGEQEAMLRVQIEDRALVKDVRAKLKGRYRPESDSSTPDIVVYNRRHRDTPYLFAVNDKRTFGEYVGQWGRTMEKGLPNKGDVSISDPDGRLGAVYELSRGGAVPFERRKGRIVMPVSYDTNDGRLFVALAKPIERVALDAAPTVARGGTVHVRFSVLDVSGPVPALLPVEIRMTDAKGREIDGGGYFCAVDGVCTVDLPVSLDDPDGVYRLMARDRASGFSATCTIERTR